MARFGEADIRGDIWGGEKSEVFFLCGLRILILDYCLYIYIYTKMYNYI